MKVVCIARDSGVAETVPIFEIDEPFSDAARLNLWWLDAAKGKQHQRADYKYYGGVVIVVHHAASVVQISNISCLSYQASCCNSAIKTKLLS